MRKKIIASAIACLSLGAAHADGTTVSIGGRIDAGYALKHSANAAFKNGAAVTGGTGGQTTETMVDNNATTSELVFKADEKLGGGYGANVFMSLRFGNYFEGKTGLSSNDRKSLAFTTPYGYVQWGVQNLAGEAFTVAEKPYTASPKDVNNLKYGVAQIRETSLTNRSTELRTNPIAVGPTNWALKGTYAIGDNRKSGDSNIDGTESGDAYSLGFEGAYGTQSNMLESSKPFMSWGFDVNAKTTSSLAASKKDGIVFAKAFYTIRPLPALKLGLSYDTYRGYNPNLVSTSYGAAFKEKNWSLDATYYWRDKLVLGAYYSRLNDLGSNRNSGKGWGLGGYYNFSKTFSAYVMYGKQAFARNETFTGGKYDGTAAGFSGNVSKLDARSTYLGVIKNF